MTTICIYDCFLECDAITTDSRDVKSFVEKGKKVIFFALKGDNFDGNMFILSALSMGAKYAVTDDMTLIDRDGLIKVSNVMQTLTELAVHHRSTTLKHTHLAITGSNGKTTTKELLLAVLSKKYSCHATFGNLNNHIGLPLTILRTPHNSNFSIIEMGANHEKEIAHLANIAKPDYGIITNIGKAHLDGFGGIEGVKRGKGELFEYLYSNKRTAFYRRDDYLLSELIERYPGLDSISYSMTDTCKVEDGGEELTVKYNNSKIKTSLVGDYNLYNIRAAIAVGEYFGVSLEYIISAIENFVPSNNRSQLVKTKWCNLVVDTYNANPTSMELSIKNFDLLEACGKVIILGEMKELGKFSLQEHINILIILENIKSADSEFYLLGDEFKEALNSYNFTKDHIWFSEVSSLCDHIKKMEYRDKLIFIKGSNSTRLSTLIDCFNDIYK